MTFRLPTHTNSRCHYMALRRKLLAGSCRDTPNYINDAIAWPFPARRRKKKMLYYQNSIREEQP